MVYVNVKEEENGERLTLYRNPSVWSWSILVGSVLFAIGAGMYGAEGILWKIVFFILAVVMGISTLEDWESCEFDKKEGHFKLKRTNLMQLLLRPFQPQPVVISRLQDITGVSISSTPHKYYGQGRQVVLKLATGISLGVTETLSYDDCGEHEAIAKKIKSFLDLGARVVEDFGSDADVESDSDHSDDSFEQLDINSINDEY